MAELVGKCLVEDPNQRISLEGLIASKVMRRASLMEESW